MANPSYCMVPQGDSKKSRKPNTTIFGNGGIPFKDTLRDRSHAQPVLSWFQHVSSSNCLAFSCIITDLTLAMGLGFVISER